jgi:putative hydrolase of the HAD superfamily
MRVDTERFEGNKRYMNKVISLDFWGTIAVFNPEYSKARTRLLSEIFERPEDEAHARYQVVKRGCDHRAETTGEAVTPLVAVKMLLLGSGCKESPVTVLSRIEELVHTYPPLLHRDVRATIQQLRLDGYIVGVASNTNFIAGALVQKIFDLPWDFAVYSDELGVSKPDKDFFLTVATRAAAAAGSSLLTHEITHIGDNSVCDVRGAQAVGMVGLLTKSPSQTMAMLKNAKAEHNGH